MLFPLFYTSGSGSTDQKECRSDQIRIHITALSNNVVILMLLLLTCRSSRRRVCLSPAPAGRCSSRPPTQSSGLSSLPLNNRIKGLFNENRHFFDKKFVDALGVDIQFTSIRNESLNHATQK